MGAMSPFPESASRVESVLAAMHKRQWTVTTSGLVDFGIDPIVAVHSREYIKYLETAYELWLSKGGHANGVMPDTFFVSRAQIFRDISLHEGASFFQKMGHYTFDTAAVIAKETYQAAYDAAQVALNGAKQLADQQRSVFALVRPPGHHSAEELAGGFCFINSAACAAQYLITAHSAKVAILDVDYHHGNGTQSIFYKSANPLFVSLHGKDDYPFFWGSEQERGEGDGEGFNVNVPLPVGTEDEQYLQALEATIKKHIVPYAPDYLVVSLGVDTFKVGWQH
ncbi:hypothetical protein HDU91_001369 [Kappamyces sp. JEL0680]|nr:hypothetical protein HDU91_001369 [Kappamyces sp. JEL0680]